MRRTILGMSWLRFGGIALVLGYVGGVLVILVQAYTEPAQFVEGPNALNFFSQNPLPDLGTGQILQIAISLALPVLVLGLLFYIAIQLRRLNQDSSQQDR